MGIAFDKFGMVERPVLTLCYPQGKELGQLGAYEELNYEIILNTYSTISFKYPKYGADKVPANLYDKVQNHMLIKAGDLGEFIINSCEETGDGIVKYLDITALSSEVQMVNRKINLLNGTYKFYDLLDPKDTLLGTIVKYLPTWKIGYVSSELITKYRTFDIPDSTLYEFLMNDVAKTYSCVFTFDTVNKFINAYTPEEFVKESDVYIGYGNFLKEEKISEVSDSMVTVLACYGGDGVNIASVNPLGTVFLYNFDHFKHMMSEELQEALANWEKAYAKYSVDYAELLTELKEVNTKLITAEANLKDAEADLASAEGVQAVQISGGRSDTADYQTTLKEIATIKNKINGYTNEITTLKADKKIIQEQQAVINKALRFDTDGGIFSEENLLELEYFKFESTHQDDNFIITDAMDLVAQQDMMQQLYDECVTLMNDVAHPTYDITADSVNFLFLQELESFISKLFDPTKAETYKQLLGVKFHLEVEEDEWIEPVLLKFHVNFDDPTDFSMEFSNKYRLNNALWTYSDLIGEAVSTNGSMSFDYSTMKTWGSERNELIEFANSSLDMTRNKLVNNTEENTFLIDSTGARMHSVTETGENTGRALWLTSDTIAMSDDNFQTVKTAIGLIATPNGGQNYGINTKYLIGQIILGSELTIANEAATMKMDANGFVVNNDKNRIWLDPENGILIQKKNGNTYTDQFYADDNGNIVLVGNITATGGEIGGFIIGEDSNGVGYIKSSNGNINLKSDGTGRIGMISIDASSTTFDGNIYAKNIQYGGTAGTLSGSAITGGSISGSKIETGGITATQIAGSTITASEIKNGTITAGKIGSKQISYGSSCVDSDSFDAEFNTIIANKGYITEARVKTLIADSAQINWLQGEPQYENGYYLVQVNGSLSTTQGMNVGMNLTVNGQLQVNGNTKIGNSSTDTLTINGARVYAASDVPGNGYYLYVLSDVL